MKLWNFFQRSPPVISEAQALRIAQRLCQERDWPWQEPVNSTLTRQGWLIRTNWASRGANAHITIHQDTGEITSARFLPR